MWKYLVKILCVSTAQLRRGESDIHGGPKSEATNSSPYFCHILLDFPKIFTGRFLGKLTANWLLKISPLFALCCHTIPCKALMLENKQLTVDNKVV